MLTWSPEQYLKFADERTRAARDLLAQVALKDPKIVYDLGCGPGNSTELLVETYPKAKVMAMDSSPEMLEKARKLLPKVAFEQGDLSVWQPKEQADLLYSNATFQWVPEHLEALKRLLAGMKTGAVLAVQMPDNRRQPSHVAMEEAGEGTAYEARLKGKARGDMPTPAEYYAGLKPLCSAFDVFHITYNFALQGAAGIVEWVKGTGLRPFLEALTPDEQKDYLSRYQALIAKAYPEQADGKVLLHFPRIFILATK